MYSIHALILSDLTSKYPTLMAIHAFQSAVIFAGHFHRNQKRKYTNEPYIYHPVAVANTLLEMSGMENDIDEDFVDNLIVAVLHDTVEDTDCTFNDIEKQFGEEIALSVWWLTDETEKRNGNREIRKAIAAEKASAAPPHCQFIKLCDILNNVSSIYENDKDFAEVYMVEKFKQCSAIATSSNFTTAGAEYPMFHNASRKILRALDEQFSKAGITPENL